MAHILSLEECLLAAISNQTTQDAQSEICIWAILEGLSRTTWGVNWHEETAVQSLSCLRGCRIPKGDTYFLFQTNTSAQTTAPFCDRCVALILYSQAVWKLPPVLHYAWDKDLSRPVRVEKRQSSAMNFPPEFDALLQAVGFAPAPVQAMWRYALVLMMIEDEKAYIAEAHQDGDTLHVIVQTRDGERFEVVRPEMSEETEQSLLDQIRELAGEART